MYSEDTIHVMDRTPKIVTIIGLILEGLGVVGSFIGYFVLRYMSTLDPSFYEDPSLSEAEVEELVQMIGILSDIVFVLGVVIGIMFIINFFVFGKLIREKYTESQAKKVYLYQAIWGGISILFNTITGILYLVSGVSGYSGHKEERNVRDGI